MSKVLTSFLENQGLNSKDIEIYLDIYKHGQSFASSVSHRTGIDRTTVYSVIKRFSEQKDILMFRRKNYVLVCGKMWLEFIK